MISMVPWWSLLLAFAGGGVFGLVLIALVSIGEDDDGS